MEQGLRATRVRIRLLIDELLDEEAESFYAALDV
jgi:hypothetical protein